jgi:hypothetical protein
MKGPNKLENLSLTGLPSYSNVLNVRWGPTRVRHLSDSTNRLGWKGLLETNTSLLGLFISYEIKSFITMATVAILCQ